MTVDLTGIAASLIAGIFAVLGIVLPLLINARVKDAQAALTLNNAVKNSLGAMQQAATDTTNILLKPVVTIPGVPASLTVPVQYVLTHAGEEAARFGITPTAIADKIDAQLGLVTIASAVSAATVPSIVAPTVKPAAQAPTPAVVPIPTPTSIGRIP